MKTFTGLNVDPLRLRAADVRVEDIAHALSMLCRFTGHAPRFYSVARHSLVVARECPRHMFAALLHDASEAYLADLSSAVKHHPLLGGYREMEARAQCAVHLAFNLPLFDERVEAAVKAADTRAGAAERELLWSGRVSPLAPLSSPLEDEAAFLDAFWRYR